MESFGVALSVKHHQNISLIPRLHEEAYMKHNESKLEANLEHTSCTCILNTCVSCMLPRANKVLLSFLCRFIVACVQPSSVEELSAC